MCPFPFKLLTFVLPYFRTDVGNISHSIYIIVQTWGTRECAIREKGLVSCAKVRHNQCVNYPLWIRVWTFDRVATKKLVPSQHCIKLLSKCTIKINITIASEKLTNQISNWINVVDIPSAAVSQNILLFNPTHKRPLYFRRAVLLTDYVQSGTGKRGKYVQPWPRDSALKSSRTDQHYKS